MTSKVSKNIRYWAWKILIKICKQHYLLNDLLNQTKQQMNFIESDYNLLVVLVRGTLVWKIYLEFLTSKIIDKKKTPIEIQIIFWLSFFQKYFLNKIPDYAIVNEAVNLAKEVNKNFSGLMNAGLKKAFQNENFLEVEVDDSLTKFCLENSFPQDLYQKFKKDWGETLARKIVYDSLNKPEISLRVNTLKITKEAFLEKYQLLLGLKPTITQSGLISQKPVVNHQVFKNGLITIQDQNSILVSEILNPKPNSRVLDMCCAPGGKLTHLAAIMKNQGLIIANEKKKNKQKLILENIQHLGVKNVKLIIGDALDIQISQLFEYILLDAPCSGWGVLKRKPDIKMNLNFSTTKELIKLQSELLEIAYKNLKRGGFFVYSTCTINKEENQNQVLNFLKLHEDMKIIVEKQYFGFEFNSDGFYICKMQKEF